MIKLDNHRQLKPDEIIRKEDFYKDNLGTVRPVKWSIGMTPSRPAYKNYTFFRRKHTKKPALATSNRTVYIRIPESKPKDKYPTVSFFYKSDEREVQVISMDNKYITGLEVNRSGDKPKYQFKKFLRSRIYGDIKLVKLADK